MLVIPATDFTATIDYTCRGVDATLRVSAMPVTLRVRMHGVKIRHAHVRRSSARLGRNGLLTIEPGQRTSVTLKLTPPV